MLYILFSAAKLNQIDLVWQQCASNYVSVALVSVGVILLQIKYSGLPYSSLSSQKKLKKIIFVNFVWALDRLCHAIFYTMRPKDLIIESTDIDNFNVNNLATSIILIVDLILEVLCFLIILETSFFSIFTEPTESQNNLLRSSITPLTSIATMPEQPDEDYIAKLDFSRYRFSDENLKLELAISDSPTKLGALYYGTLKGLGVAIRVLKLIHVSKYVRETIEGEINSLKEFKNTHYRGVIGIIYSYDSLKIITNYMANSSLHELLHDRKKHFSTSQKLLFACEIAACIKYWHDRGRVHGHITSHNILFDSDFKVVITDLGFEVLKKYSGLVSGYANKSS